LVKYTRTQTEGAKTEG
jgi:CO dehydrogenase/acetyl-CoA synthase beta subunit